MGLGLLTFLSSPLGPSRQDLTQEGRKAQCHSQKSHAGCTTIMWHPLLTQQQQQWHGVVSPATVGWLGSDLLWWPIWQGVPDSDTESPHPAERWRPHGEGSRAAGPLTCICPTPSVGSPHSPLPCVQIWGAYAPPWLPAWECITQFFIVVNPNGVAAPSLGTTGLYFIYTYIMYVYLYKVSVYYWTTVGETIHIVQ